MTRKAERRIRKIPSLIDYSDKNSLSYRFRHNRVQLFTRFVQEVSKEEGKKSLKILDVGGTLKYWQTFGFPLAGHELTLLNISIPVDSINGNIQFIKGDARCMRQLEDQSFDIVFSNSVIEHLYSWKGQNLMAREVKRVGKYYFIQTPNLYFPVEPHYILPYFQFFPLGVKKFLHSHFELTGKKYLRKPLSKNESLRKAREIKLLSKKQLKTLFDDCNLYAEKVLYLSKSFICYSGNIELFQEALNETGLLIPDLSKG